MKKTILRLLPLAVFLLSLNGFAQQDPKRMYDPKKILEYLYSNSNITLEPSEIEGTMYVTNDYVPARFMENGTIYSVRYNAYSDEFEIRDKGVVKYLPKISEYEIELINTSKKYKVFKKGGNPGFFVLLSEGENVSLLLKESIKFNQEVIAKTSYDKSIPPSFSRNKDELYIGFKNNTAVELPNRKKDILKLFASNSSLVEKYAKKNNLSFKKVPDLIKIFDYYNTL